MPLNYDLEPGDSLIVPPNSGAHIRIVEKTGRKTKVAVESALPVQIVKARKALYVPTPGGDARPVPRIVAKPR